MKSNAVGRRYAKALLSLADEQHQTERVEQDLEALRAAWEQSAELRALAHNPIISRELLKRTFTEILERAGASAMVKNTVKLLVDRGRIGELPAVFEAFGALASERSGKVVAQVTTAHPMPDAYYDDLKRQLEKATGLQIVFDKRQDPSILGGVVARVGDKVFDGSVRNRLDELKASLLNP
ncbi:MAG: ATP synthase F1 subunit delta [Myxococcales bacterium]|nr:ATP synthase F1 subunit delta [Myxococcales bacterium]